MTSKRVTPGTRSEFSDRVAVVTGASGSIGGAICLGLAERGAEVCAVARDRKRIESRLARASRPTPIKLFIADLTDDLQVEGVVKQVHQEAGSIDILVHCAAVITLAPVSDGSVAELDRLYRTNLRAPFLLTQLALPSLLETKGSVVFVNSSAGIQARRSTSQYAATKHGLRALADSLREEVNDSGIRVLTVYPGRTAGPMQAAVHEMEGRVYKPEELAQPEDVATVVLDALSLPRTSEVTDIRMRPFRKPSEGSSST